MRGLPEGRAVRWAAIALVVFYVISLGMWIVAPKPVQFYYHYFLPAMALSARWRWGWTGCGNAVLAARLGDQPGELACFAYWFPILTAALPDDPQDFLRWAWPRGWR